MKKFWLLIVAWIAIILSWCTNDKEACTWDVCTLDNETPVEETQVAETPFFGNRENSAKWAVAMQKPSIDEMENYDAILIYDKNGQVILRNLLWIDDFEDIHIIVTTSPRMRLRNEMFLLLHEVINLTILNWLWMMKIKLF